MFTIINKCMLIDATWYLKTQGDFKKRCTLSFITLIIICGVNALILINKIKCLVA